MGAYLDAPITDLNPVDGKGSYVKWGACGMQGWRCSMEDTHICEEVKLPSDDAGYVFGVFDGHGGSEVAIYVKDHFMTVLKKATEWQQMNYEGALDSTFMKVDEMVSEQSYA